MNYYRSPYSNRLGFIRNFYGRKKKKTKQSNNLISEFRSQMNYFLLPDGSSGALLLF